MEARDTTAVCNQPHARLHPVWAHAPSTPSQRSEADLTPSHGGAEVLVLLTSDPERPTLALASTTGCLESKKRFILNYLIEPIRRSIHHESHGHGDPESAGQIDPKR